MCFIWNTSQFFPWSEVLSKRFSKLLGFLASLPSCTNFWISKMWISTLTSPKYSLCRQGLSQRNTPLVLYHSTSTQIREGSKVEENKCNANNYESVKNVDPLLDPIWTPIWMLLFLNDGEVSRLSGIIWKYIWPISQKHVCYFSAVQTYIGTECAELIGECPYFALNALEIWTEIRNAGFFLPLWVIQSDSLEICLDLWKPC